MFQDLTPTQYKLIKRAYDLSSKGITVTRGVLYDRYYESEAKSLAVVSSTIQHLKNRGFVSVTRRKEEDHSYNTYVVDVLPEGEEAIARYEDGTFLNRPPLEKTGLCDECNSMAKVYYFKSKYLCENCLNPEKPIVCPNLMRSSMGLCLE